MSDDYRNVPIEMMMTSKSGENNQ